MTMTSRAIANISSIYSSDIEEAIPTWQHDQGGITLPIEASLGGVFADNAGADRSANALDWSGSIQLVRDVAARVRAMHQRALATAHEAHDIAHAATVATNAAEDRARAAEVAANAALARASQAEENLRILSQQLSEAEQRAAAAERSAKESLYWLQKMHDCLSNEFIELTVE